LAAPDGLTAQGSAGAPRASASTVAAAPDPLSDEQWALRGDRPMGIATAWRQTRGGGVTVAILDSGADLTHPDLAANLWTNPRAQAGEPVADLHGYNFVAGNGDVGDDNGHGTHVAGIIGAVGGNHLGGTGVAWRVGLMIVKVLDDQGKGQAGTVAKGIYYAVDNGARIINLSLAGPDPSQELEDAISYAQAKGVLVVAAAGNSGTDLATAPAYPASFPEDNVIGVAATTAAGKLSSSSDFGTGAKLAAPGESILSTAADGGYEWRSGTSMAAAEVSGALALLASARPELSGAQLRDALYAGVRHTGLLVETGAVDIGASLRTIIPAAAWKKAPPTTTTTRRGRGARARPASG
jgi:subtilisin family serine protease